VKSDYNSVDTLSCRFYQQNRNRCSDSRCETFPTRSNLQKRDLTGKFGASNLKSDHNSVDTFSCRFYQQNRNRCSNSRCETLPVFAKERPNRENLAPQIAGSLANPQNFRSDYNIACAMSFNLLWGGYDW